MAWSAPPTQNRLSTRVNVMSVDLEEYFTVQNLDERVPRDVWDAQPMRSDTQTRLLLDLFDRYETRATFFVLGWVAERQKALVKEIHERGHEIAAHSYWHRLVFEQTPDEFREDLRRVKQLLEDIIGSEVIGYRAPTYSVTKKSLWAHDILREEGFKYSSSIFPIRHDRYGIHDFGRFPRNIDGLIEFPMTTFPVLGKNLPVAGGGYLRLFPVEVIARALAQVNNKENEPAVVYLHPWEIDPDIPKYSVSFLRDFRGYVGLGKMSRKLEYLLQHLSFNTMQEVLDLAPEKTAT